MHLPQNKGVLYHHFKNGVNVKWPFRIETIFFCATFCKEKKLRRFLLIRHIKSNSDILCKSGQEFVCKRQRHQFIKENTLLNHIKLARGIWWPRLSNLIATIISKDSALFKSRNAWTKVSSRPTSSSMPMFISKNLLTHFWKRALNDMYKSILENTENNCDVH